MKANTKKIITRFPPSPTGFLHIGSVRTALFNYLFSAHEGGKMYLRFEDTDRERSKKEFEDDIVEGLHWLGIPYEMPAIARQSERTDIYKAHFQTLLNSGRAYEAEISENNPAKKVVRFKNPNTVITFGDLVRGPVTFDTTELGDFVIARSVDEPLYHLAVVIDDHEMGITHVIRGEDHISNTPRQILMLEALGFKRPLYAHIPLILAPDRTKLSKRHGAVSVNEYRRMGFIPEALLNYLVFLGWNPGTNRELFTLSELVNEFGLEHVQKGGAIFSTEKLLWFNREHIKMLSREEFRKRLYEFAPELLKDPSCEILLPLMHERANTLKEAADLISSSEFSFVRGVAPYDSAKLIPAVKGKTVGKEDIQKHFAYIRQALEAIPNKEFSAEKVKEAIWEYAAEKGRGEVLWPMRFALSGAERSPDPFTIAGVIGKEETLARLLSASKKL